MINRVIGRKMMKNRQQIILTFDDGPHPVWTGIILDLLKKYDVKAVFFLVGKKVAAYPFIVTELIRQGHTIGNHTWSHKPLFLMNKKTLQYEINDYHRYLKDKFNYQMQFFRPPWGLISAKQRRLIKDQFGYNIFLWNKDSGDYIWPYERNLYNTIARVKQSPCAVLFHDGIILSPLLTRKHMICTLEKLLQLKDIHLDFILPDIR